MARPRINPRHHKKNITLTLSPALIDAAKQASYSTGEPISVMVESLLTKHLTEFQSCLLTASLKKRVGTSVSKQS